MTERFPLLGSFRCNWILAGNNEIGGDIKFKPGILIGIIILAAFNIPARAQFENAILDTLTADTLEDYLTTNSLAVNGYEEFHLAYCKSREGGGYNLYYKFFDIYNGIYPESAVVTDMTCYEPSIASRYSDNDYDIVIVYENLLDIYSLVAHDRYGPWERTNITNSLEHEIKPRIAYGSNYYHCTWITAYWEGKITYMRGGHGEPPIIDILEESQLGTYDHFVNPVIVAAGDVPHIFYNGITPDSIFHIQHATRLSPDSDWVIEQINTPNFADWHVAAAVDMPGDIHLAISGKEHARSFGRVYYTFMDHETGQWSTPELAVSEALLANITLGLGTNLFIASVGFDSSGYNGILFLTSRINGVFETQRVDSFTAVGTPLIANVIGEFGVIIAEAAIDQNIPRNIELIYYGPDIGTSITEPILPERDFLDGCFPNPFNSQTIIRFGVSHPAAVKLEIFDVTGRQLKVIDFEATSPGIFEVPWDARGFSSGIYFCRIDAGNFSAVKKMVLLK